MKDWSNERLKAWSQNVFGFEPERLEDVTLIGKVDTELVFANNAFYFNFLRAQMLFVGQLHWQLQYQMNQLGGLVRCRTYVRKVGNISIEDSLGVHQLFNEINYVDGFSNEMYLSGNLDNCLFTSIIFQPGFAKVYFTYQATGKILYYPHEIFKRDDFAGGAQAITTDFYRDSV